MLNENLLGKKLYELRKKANLSQEEFAEKLNISRQAVSKWECGDTLPDTENLIKISKLYGVSLDELVGNINLEQEQENNDTQNSDSKSTDKTGIPIDDEGDVHINVHVNPFSAKRTKKELALQLLIQLPYPILVTIAYLLWGFLGNGWTVGWTLYVTIPVYSSLIDCIRQKKASHFAYPVLITFIYLFVGMQWGFWHPNWVLFVSVPIYYAITDAIERK